MGGKTKNYYDLQAQTIYAQDENLYRIELLREFASYQDILPPQFTTTMLNAINKYLSAPVLKAFDMAATLTAVSQYITMSSMASEIRRRTGHPVVAPYTYDAVDISGDPISGRMKKAVDYLEETYDVNTSFTRSFCEAYTFAVRNENSIGYEDCMDKYRYFTSLDVFHLMHSGSTFDASICIDSHLYSSDNGTTWWAVHEPEDFSSNKILMDEMQWDGSQWVPTGTTKYVSIPVDSRTVIFSRYAYRNDYDSVLCDCITGYDCWLNPNGWYEDQMLLYKEDIVTESDSRTVFVIPLKHGGGFVSTKNYQKVIMNQYGFKYDDFYDSLSNEDISEAFISYSTNNKDNENQAVKDAITALYGKPGSWYHVSVRHDMYTIDYYQEVVEDLSGYDDPEIFHKIEVNNHAFTIDDSRGRALMVPVEVVKELSFQEKYDFIKMDMCIWGYVHQTVHLKWYQTGFFKFVMMVVAIAFTMFTMNPGILQAASVMLTIASPALSKALGSEAAAIIGFVTMAYLSPGSFTGYLDSFQKNLASNIYKIATNIGEMWFKSYMKQEMGQVRKQLTQYQREEEEMRKTMEEMTKPYLYIPLAGYDSFYDNAINLPYKIYSDASYDQLGMLNRSLMTGV